MPDRKEVHAHHEAATVPKAPWWQNKNAKMAGMIIGSLSVVAFIMWLIFFMPYTATDDARIDADVIKAANLGASAQIIKIYVKEGDRVAAGTLLVELDHTMAQTQLERAQAHSNYTAVDFKRNKNVGSQQGISQQQVDRTFQEAAIAQADVKLAQIALDRTYIKSPVDGVVIQKTADEGNILETNQTAVIIADMGHAWVSANILEKAVHDVKIGQRVYVSVDEGGELNGKVADVRKASASMFALIPSDNASGNFVKVEQRIPIKIELEPHTDRELRVGESVQIRIKIR
jgi:membrane fusion protein (multidrug efflux system)